MNSPLTLPLVTQGLYLESSTLTGPLTTSVVGTWAHYQHLLLGLTALSLLINFHSLFSLLQHLFLSLKKNASHHCLFQPELHCHFPKLLKVLLFLMASIPTHQSGIPSVLEIQKSLTELLLIHPRRMSLGKVSNALGCIFPCIFS